MKKSFLLMLFFSFSLIFVPKAQALNNTSIEDAMTCNKVTQAMKDYYNTNFTSMMNDLGVPMTAGGHTLNKATVLHYCLAAYGSPFAASGDDPNGISINGHTEYRYLGYTAGGKELSNPYFPNDTSITSDYTKINNFTKYPWNYSQYINTGNVLPPVYTQNTTNSTRIKELGAGVDLPYIESSSSFPSDPQGYLVQLNTKMGLTMITSGLGSNLTDYAYVEAYATTYISGEFELYNESVKTPNKYYYHSYLLPPKQNIFQDPPDFYIDTNTFSITPAAPLPNQNVSVTIRFYNKNNTGTTYYNVPLEFGWTNTNPSYWCVQNGVTLSPGWNTFTFDSSKTYKCSGSTSTFKYPSDGGYQTFYANINFPNSSGDHAISEKNDNYNNNYYNFLVQGDYPSVVAGNCEPNARLCITHYPQYPSTRTEGGSATYYDGLYKYFTEGSGNTRVLPSGVSFTYSLKDPKDTIFQNATWSKSLPSSCYNGLDLSTSPSCQSYQFYIGNNQVFSAIPPISQKTIFNNTGNYILSAKATESRIIRWNETTCDNNVPSICTTTLKQANYSDLITNVTDDDYVTGISTGLGNN